MKSFVWRRRVASWWILWWLTHAETHGFQSRLLLVLCKDFEHLLQKGFKGQEHRGESTDQFPIGKI